MFVLPASRLLSRKRQLILTSRPRLLYVDPKAMQLKGEVPWSAQLRAEVRHGPSHPC